MLLYAVHMKRFLSMLAVLVALVAPTASAPSAEARNTVPKHVLVLGDSILGGSSNYVSFYMGNAGDGSVVTTIRSVGGTAICDLFPGNGGPWTIHSLLAERRYNAVVMAYSGNNMSRCMDGLTGQAAVDRYRMNAHTIMRVAAQYGSPTVVWVKPFAARDAGLDYIRTGVGRAYVDMQLSWPNARSLDAGYLLEDQGRWADILACQSWDPCGYGVVRIGDPDGVHLWCDSRPPAVYGVVQPCNNYSAGSNRYGMNLAGTRQFIGL